MWAPFAGSKRCELTCVGGGLFIVFLALWTFGGGLETARLEEEGGAGGSVDLLVPGPDTLILALPGEEEKEVEGEEEEVVGKEEEKEEA